MSDAEQQKEMEEERMMISLEVLQRVSRGLATTEDVMYLASELGLTTEWSKHERNSGKG